MGVSNELALSFAGKSKTLNMIMHFRFFEDDSKPIPHLMKNHIPSLNLRNQIHKFWIESINQKKKNISF